MNVDSYDCFSEYEKILRCNRHGGVPSVGAYGVAGDIAGASG
jgi:hypothetical protein